jgi:3-phenylpropionate/trans-cinnamate dioxygenase ferredoxin reductase subunit
VKAPERIVVVGASAAGASAAHALRAAGYGGALALVGEESDLPYDRPPLSKQALLGPWQPEKLQLINAAGYSEMAIDLVLGSRAVQLDLDQRTVRLSDGERLAFDGLIIATGSSPRMLPSLSAAVNVHSLRTTGDAMKLRQVFEKKNARLAVIGAGFVGTELAATARMAGLSVTLIDSAANPLEARLGPTVGKLLTQLHRAQGVDLRMGVSMEGAVGSLPGQRIEALRLSDGSMVECDAVVVAIGAAPNIDWLKNSGLQLGNGVECDSFCRVAEGIYAAGDVAEWLHPGYGRRLRIEHRTNAAEQAVAAAKNMLGANTPYAPMPFFWSDQYEAKLQMHGVVSHTNDVRVLHGTLDDARFALGFYAHESLTGVLSWGAPKQARQWIPVLRSHWKSF